MVEELVAGARHRGPRELTAVGEELFFQAPVGEYGGELWRSDGSRSGTVLIKNIDPFEEYSHSRSTHYAMTDVGGTLFMGVADGVHGWEPWRSDGTRKGTVLVEDINKIVTFGVARHGSRDLDAGTMAVEVTAGAAGRLVVTPADGTEVRRSSQQLPKAGTATIILRPTEAGLRALRREGRLRVRAQFTYTPCSGPPRSSETRAFTLALH
jgi:ELWxxDGT repeat protein